MTDISSVTLPERWAGQEGDLEAVTMAFPVTIHERIAPGTDLNNPNGMYEAVHRQIR